MTQISLSHVASCPEISPVDCAEQGDIPDHSHHQDLFMAQVGAIIGVGLGHGMQLKGRLPLSIKKLEIEYQDENGKVYTPPYAGIHHRNETLTGLGDGELMLEYFSRVGEDWVLGGGVGATLPLGRTEADPYARAELSLVHQHMQMGSGTLDPVLSASAVYGGHTWGLASSARTRLALSTNDKGYRPSSMHTVGIGPTYRLAAKWMLTSSVDLLSEGQASWNGTPDPMSGRTSLIGTGGLIYRLSTTTALMGQGRITAAQWSEADLIKQAFVGVVGLSFTPGKH
jgi:hypothetical protein